jgi:NitT/TauT family transport system substrate-binding protein
MADYMMSNEFKASDIAYFQKFFDLFTERGIFSRKVDVGALLYKA